MSWQKARNNLVLSMTMLCSQFMTVAHADTIDPINRTIIENLPGRVMMEIMNSGVAPEALQFEPAHNLLCNNNNASYDVTIYNGSETGSYDGPIKLDQLIADLEEMPGQGQALVYHRNRLTLMLVFNDGDVVAPRPIATLDGQIFGMAYNFCRA